MSYRTVLLCVMLAYFPLQAAEPLPTLTTPPENIPEHMEKVSFAGADNFPISGTLYKGNPKSGGVILLHDCSHDSRSYRMLGDEFSRLGVNALAIDLRGFGESSSAVFSHQKVKQKSKDITSYQSELMMLASYWDKDVIAGYHFLRSKLEKGKGISVVASECSVIHAVAVAEKFRVNSFVMISPVMDYMQKERYKNLIDIPTFFITSIHDTDSLNTTKELYLWNGSSTSASLTYKGNRKGYKLLRGKPHILSGLALWVETHLLHSRP